jgi:hypothetical protein
MRPPARRRWHGTGGRSLTFVTDVRLPGSVDGWQIAERCREQDPELPRDLRERLLAGRAPDRCQEAFSCESRFPPEEVVRA